MTKDHSNMVFVFGSNLAGIHGAGAAAYANRHKGAIYGIGEGPQGNSYAIPTKGKRVQKMPLSEVIPYINNFIELAKQYPLVEFQVTQIGCGFAGFTKEQVAPLFKGSPKNCYFDLEWQPLLGDNYNYWI